ncbi:hypothetical protein HPB50_005514 [Hyalomma asiaticum]|uniref:Uncharacterized protein n=1 Tax=Hyalomma asiaticum TaxID=266040 RepID=A0ACB7S6P1_HYAAI|nr:hypothetical protein HPB50_005514 [Hyalomma asiaticum]
MDLVEPPPPLVLSGNTTKNWGLFKQRGRSEAAKTALLLTIAGEDALEVFNNFSFSENESKDDYGTVTGKFEEYCRQQHNEVQSRDARNNALQP